MLTIGSTFWSDRNRQCGRRDLPLPYNDPIIQYRNRDQSRPGVKNTG